MKTAPLAFLFLLTAASVGAFAQADAPIKLRVSQRIDVPSVPPDAFGHPLLCDADGNIYRTATPAQRRRNNPIQRLSADGKDVVDYNLDALTGPQITSADYFTVSPDGVVYQIAGNWKENFIVRFEKDGRPRSCVRLDRSFSPSQLAVFKSGQFLATGRMYVKGDDGKSVEKLVTAIFGEDGKFLRSLTLPDDTELMRRVKSGDPESVNPNLPGSNRPLDFGNALSGPDGNVYVMRWTNPAWVYVISPAGDIVKRLEVKPPQAGYMPDSMQLNGNELALFFETEGQKKRFIEIINLADAEVPHKIFDSEGLGGAFSCYIRDFEFAFLSSTNTHLRILHAIPE